MATDDFLRLINIFDRRVRTVSGQIARYASGQVAASFGELTNRVNRVPSGQSDFDRGALLSERVTRNFSILSSLQRDAINQRIQNRFGELQIDALEHVANMLAIADESLLTRVGASPAILNSIANLSAQWISSSSANLASSAELIFLNAPALGNGPININRVLQEQLARTSRQLGFDIGTSTWLLADRTIQDIFQQQGLDYYIHVTQLDERVCRFCASRAGQIYRIGQSNPVLHFNDRCVLPAELVHATGIKASTARQYSGQTVRIQTALGNVLSVTPNHPILTDKGWVNAGFLGEGDCVISCTDPAQLFSVLAPFERYWHGPISEVAASFSESRGVCHAQFTQRSGSFHGDGCANLQAFIWAQEQLFLDAGRWPQPPFHVGHLQEPTATNLNLFFERRDLVQRDRIARIDCRHYDGLVYNLQTSSNWYLSNRIVTHNCQAIPVRPEWLANGTIDIQGLQEHRAAALRRVSSPNNGVAPMERFNGLTEPPKPIPVETFV